MAPTALPRIRRRERSAAVREVGRAGAFSLALTLGSYASYALVTNVLADVRSVSHGDDVIGGLWAAIATVFVLRPASGESVAAAKTRASATVLSFVLCLVYLLFLPFHAWAPAVLIGVGAFILVVTGLPGDVPVAGITTAVVMVSAAISPHDAWQQPLLRALDTAVGIAVGLAASWLLGQVRRGPPSSSARTTASLWSGSRAA